MGVSTVREGTCFSEDSSFSVLEPGGAVFGAVRAEGEGRHKKRGAMNSMRHEICLKCYVVDKHKAEK